MFPLTRMRRGRRSEGRRGAKGPTVPVDAAYHQMYYTNLFRKRFPYGMPEGSFTAAEVQAFTKSLYRKYPLPPP